MKSKTKKIIYWTFTIIFCLGMLFSGSVEFTHVKSVDEVII